MGEDPAFRHAYALIMAGGSGTRFWPLSRRKRPKQLLQLLGPQTLLEQSVARLKGIIPPSRILVFTNELLRRQIIRRLPSIPPEQIVAEPAARNTAPTIGLAAHEILRRDPEGLMVVLPSDHVIARPAEFRRVLRAACRWASAEGRSVTVGLKPTRPDTGYGYVRRGRRVARLDGQEIFRVDRFTEKPPLPRARQYLASGRYLWNGGLFIWRASTLLDNLRKCQPRMARGLAKISAAGGAGSRAVLRREYPRLEKISIDYAVMEKISEVYVVAADIGWSDVGSWGVVYGLQKPGADKNVVRGKSVCLDSSGNMIVASGRAVVAVGVRDMVIVETPDAILVCPRARSQDVGRAVQELERRGWLKLL